MKFEVDNKIWQEDIESIADSEIIDSFKDSVVLITGATGLIGKVIALARNLDKANEIFKNVINNDNFEIIVQDILKPIAYNKKIDYIIHCANSTSSKEMLEKPVEMIEVIYLGTKNVLDFAKQNDIKSVLYLSSLEIYGLLEKEGLINEEDFGYIDLNNPRNSYPEAKRMAENLCSSYANEFNLDIKIARLTQTFGAGISLDDNRVFAQFAKSAFEKKDIILHTKGETTRNYCYLTDAIIGLLTILVKGEKSKSYNLANKNTKISILDMAKLVAKQNDINVCFKIDDINRGYNPKIIACLNPEKLENLGWNPKVELGEMFDRLIKYLKENK